MRNTGNPGVDLMQVEVLSALFRAQIDTTLVVKGGWAMRANFGATRMTKDIDLAAAPHASKASIQNRITRALKAVASTGLFKKVEITQPKQTETTQRWKVSADYEGAPIHLTIEVSKRDLVPAEYIVDVEISQKDGRAINVKAYSPAMLAAAKIACILDDKRTAPRDVFDLHLLIENEAAPVEAHLETLLKHKNFNLEFVKDKIESMSWDLVGTELIPFLDPSINFDECDWECIREEVLKAFEFWMGRALSDDEIPSIPGAQK